MISPDFASAASIPVFEYENPSALQLAIIGSRSTINYGSEATLNIGESTVQVEFDVVNIDHYDAIVGIPILSQLKSRLDFSGDKPKVWIGNECFVANEPPQEGGTRPVGRLGKVRRTG